MSETVTAQLESPDPKKLLPMRTVMFSLEDPADHTKRMGSLESGGGFYNDTLIFHWKEETRVVRGYHLFKAWVEQIDPEGAKRLP